VHLAVGLLCAAELTSAYEDAWQAWTASGEAGTWEAATADGVEAGPECVAARSAPSTSW
jgi:hypothetical protein